MPDSFGARIDNVQQTGPAPFPPHARERPSGMEICWRRMGVAYGDQGPLRRPIRDAERGPRCFGGVWGRGMGAAL